MVGAFDEKSPAGRRFSVFAGFILTILSTLLLWVGMNSFLVGLAYMGQKGYWVPFIVGVVLSGVSCWFLFRTLRQITENVSSEKEKDFY